MTGCYTGCTPPTLGHAEFITPPPTTLPPHLVAHAVGQMPFTGADIVTLLVVGLAAVALGFFLARRRRSAA